MTKTLLLTCYDSYCLGIRVMGKLLEESGHEVNLLFFKIRNEERINQPLQDANFSQSLRGACVFTNHYQKDMWSDEEKTLLIKRIKALDPDLICFSTRSFLDKANIQLLPDIKKAVPDCVLIAGGYGPTSNPELYADICDFVGIGEGEELVLEIARAIDKKESFYDVENLFYKKGNQYIRTPLRPLADVDKIKIPILASDNVSYIEDNKCFDSDPALTVTDHTTIMGRGCVGKCTYCTEVGIQRVYESYSSNPFTRRNRNVDSIIEELEFAVKKGFKSVTFVDSFLVGKRDYLLKFFNEYRVRIGLPLTVQLHLIQIIKYPEIMDAACDAGVRFNVIGIQSGSERISRGIYNRKFSNKDLLKFAHMIIDRGIDIEYHLIVGNPLETDEDINETYHLLKLLPFRPHKDELYCFQLRTAPGAPLTELLKNRNLKPIATNDWLYLSALCQLRMLIEQDLEFDAIRKIEFFKNNPKSLCNLIRDIYSTSISRLDPKEISKGVKTKPLYSSYLET